MTKPILLWIHGRGDRDASDLRAYLESADLGVEHRSLHEEALSGHLEEAPDDLIIGAVILPSVGSPAAAARLFFRRLPGREVLFIAETDNGAVEKRDINLAFLYGHHRTINASDPEDALRAIRRLIGQANRQRRFRSALSRINKQLAQPYAKAAVKRRLAISDRLLASILAQTPDPLFALDIDGYLLAANAAAMERFNLAGAEGTSFEETDLVKRLPELKDLVSISIRERETSRREMALSGDAPEQFFEISASPVFDEGRRLIGITVLLRNVTRLKAAQRDLRELNEALETRVNERTRELKEVNQQMEGFLYSVAHDLRAPIRTIRGFTEILREDFGKDLDETAGDLLERVIQASGRMDFLIRDLLTYSRVAKIEMPVEPVALDEVYETVRASMAEQVANARAEVQIDPAPGTVLVHRTTLEQAVINLFSNALHYAKPGEPPRVRISTLRRNGVVRIQVEDDGVGIEPIYHEKIFQIFERIPTSSNISGTGVGLAIVKRGIERMGGRVGVDSEPGKGSSFWIELRELAEATMVTGEGAGEK